jgi:hypothetical protein
MIVPTASCSACGPLTGTILDHHAESPGVADTLDRRRRHPEYQRLLDSSETAVQFSDDGTGGFSKSFARSANGSSTTNSAPELGALVKVAPEKPTTSPRSKPLGPQALSRRRDD